MSLEAMVWALKQAPVYEPTRVLVLMGLADRADDDGTAAYPSNKNLALKARCSERTVQRHLRVLESEGLIRRGDQRLVAHFRADHRPVVWDLDLSKVREDDEEIRAASTARARGRKERGDADDTPYSEAQTEARGDAHVANGATPTSPKPSLEPSLKPFGDPDGSPTLFVVSDDPKPAAKKPRPRDPLFDAIAMACRVDIGEMTASAASGIGKVRREIAAAGGTPEEVPVRADEYRRRFPRADLTPQALAKWWPALGGSAPSANASWLDSL